MQDSTGQLHIYLAVLLRYGRCWVLLVWRLTAGALPQTTLSDSTLHGFSMCSIEHVSACTFLRAHLPPLLSYYTCKLFVLPLARCLFYHGCLLKSLNHLAERTPVQTLEVRRTTSSCALMPCRACGNPASFHPNIGLWPFRAPQDMLLFAHVEPFSLQYVLIAFAVVSLSDFPRALHVMFTAQARLQLQFSPLTSPGNVSSTASHQPDAGNTAWTAIPGKVGDH